MPEDYRDTCDQPCCNPQLLYSPADIHDGSQYYHRKHATINTLSSWESPATVWTLRQKSGSWGYLSPYNRIVFDESGHVWIREDAELRPTPGISDADRLALVFWTTYNNVGVRLHPKTYENIKQYNLTSLKSWESTSTQGVIWRPVSVVVDDVPEGLVRFPY